MNIERATKLAEKGRRVLSGMEIPAYRALERADKMIPLKKRKKRR